MRDFLQELKKFFRKGDMVLLLLCIATSFPFYLFYHFLYQK